MNADRLISLLELWQRGFRIHAAIELLEYGQQHEIARFAAQIALEFGSNEATMFCEFVQRSEEANPMSMRRASLSQRTRTNKT